VSVGPDEPTEDSVEIWIDTDDDTAGGAAHVHSDLVKKSGDTMTGPLVLPGDPASALQAATKGYVDKNALVSYDLGIVTTAADGSYVVNVPAGTFSGNLHCLCMTWGGEPLISGIAVGGTATTQTLIFRNHDGTAANARAVKIIVLGARP
jgi:hypothetical protein